MNDNPLSWQRFTALDDSFPRGNSSYGGTGGSSTHTHDVTITTGGPSATGGSKAIGQTTASASHTHSCNTTTDAGSNIPPYMEVIFAQRNDPVVSTSLGSEEPQETEPGEEEVTYQYTYNGDGAMVMESTGTVTTIYIGGIYEYVISGAEVITRSYYYAGSQRVAMRENDALFYLLGDHLGSTSLTLDASGNKVAEQRYKPYGSTRYEWGTSQTQYQFTGQRKVDLGIYYYQARFYDASLGQFLSPDTIIPSPGNVLDWNRYLYTRGNPIRYLDPSGHVCMETSGGNMLCSDDADTAWYPNNPLPPLFKDEMVPENEITELQWYGNTEWAFYNGDAYGYDTYSQGLHAGIDLATLDGGVPIYAGVYGKVIGLCTPQKCSFRPGWIRVRASTGIEYTILYGHVADIQVKSGDIVQPDTLLGFTHDEEQHLHLEVYYQDKDGNDWLTNPFNLLTPEYQKVLLAVEADMRDVYKYDTRINFRPIENWSGTNYRNQPDFQRKSGWIWDQ